jgi:hypothetical protein
MKYVCDRKYGYHEFDTAEECLRFEGACEAKQNASNSGCLWGLFLLAIFGVLLFG